ncbi:MAG: hypothetical protein IT212_12065 [Bacteroidia bacterium]|nr:hypothetical protein [Bacteroidota bacterium]MCC7515415.1 hypothetical protein [Bacteroidia bacterium]MCO5261200.1 hypothetical protein [Crocinitomicaceae bacterium]
MTRKLMTYLNKKYNKVALQTQCLLLLFKNFLLIKTLKLESVSLYDRVVIQGNEVEMLWNVRGCHKIKIKGIGVLPGNIHGLKFQFTNRNNPIEITFCGIAKQQKKQIRINNAKINLLEKFIATIEIPVPIEVPYIKRKFKCELIKDNLKMELKNVYFEFEPFNIDNYKPLNTI